MDVRHHLDPVTFQPLATELYSADPVRHTLALTVMARYLTGDAPASDRSVPIMLTVHDGADLVGVALRTPPFPLIASGLPADPALLKAVVAAWRDIDPELPAVNGPRPEAEAFAAAWARQTGASPREVMAGRLYRLAELTPPSVPGGARLATEGDLSTLVEWSIAFEIEAMGHERQPGEMPNIIRRRFAVGDGLALWEVAGEPVSWAVASPPIGGMSRVGPVYTTPERRGNGYGSAVTAAATQWALDAGADQVLLFTDLANPTSNSIYQKIGYRPVYDSTELEFRPLPSNP